jgi:F420H(2)-dependent quinone reductase
MRFRNRLVNPVVRLLLRSTLHRLLSGWLVILSYQGRKSGRWYSLPCMYACDGQDLHVLPAHKVWWRNLRQPTPVRVRLQGRDLQGTATATSDPEVVAGGLGCYLARYLKAAKPLRAWLDANGIPHRTDTHPLVVVTVGLTAAGSARAAAKGLPPPNGPHRCGSNDPDRPLPVGRR